jgi:hypothetical protein
LRRKETCCLVSAFVSALASLLEADFVSDPVSNLAAFLAVTLLRGVAADLLE